MEKVTYQFSDFLSEVNDDYKEFVTKIHEDLLEKAYKPKIESKASGFFISYSHPKTKRSVLNLLFRKKGLIARIYADNYAGYADFLENLPQSMEAEIEKASVCKRLVNPEDCSSKCKKGYDFFIKGKHYQKCRYSCFQFVVTADSAPAITEFINLETPA